MVSAGVVVSAAGVVSSAGKLSDVAAVSAVVVVALASDEGCGTTPAPRLCNDNEQTNKQKQGSLKTAKCNRFAHVMTAEAYVTL